MSGQHIYSPLSRPASIRLLRIAPGYPWNDIVCELVLVDDLEQAPTYEALSYAWGDPSVTVPITCNGVSKSVTTNLAAALRRVRSLPDSPTINHNLVKLLLQSRSKLRTLGDLNLPSFARRLSSTERILSSIDGLIWIDALCINQEDLAEKSAQVALMPNIYQTAARVIVWLGEDTSDTVIALNMLSIGLDGYYKEKPPDVERYLPREEALFRDRNKLRGFPDMGSSSWDALGRFLSRSWFSRGWVIQEVALSRSCVMIVGDLELDWKAVGRATYWMQSKGYSGVPMNNIDEAALTRAATIWEIQAPPRHTKLSFLLSCTKSFRVSLPQDKIYSLLALAMKTSDSARQADYSKSASEVFRGIVRSIIDEEQSLLVLAEVDHGVQCPDQGTSWVPTWVSTDIKADLGLNKFSKFRADSARKLSLGFSQSMEVLYLDGIVFDSVVYSTDIVTKYIKSTHDTQQKQIWNEMTQKLGAASATYASGQHIGIAFTQALTQGVDQHSEIADGNLAYYLDAAAYWKRLGVNDLHMICLQEAKTLEQASGLSDGHVGHHDPVIVAVGQGTFGRRIFLTATGYLGVGPAAMRLGDEICILYGGTHPFVLRADHDKHRLVGACYVQGIMQGEAIERVEAEDTDATRTFALF